MLINLSEFVHVTNPAIQAGHEAWISEKAAAASSRERWRLIGEALLVGQRLHASIDAFGQWCHEHGLSEVEFRCRPHAMWLAENWDDVQSLSITEGHPTNIRVAYNDTITQAFGNPVSGSDSVKLPWDANSIAEKLMFVALNVAMRMFITPQELERSMRKYKFDREALGRIQQAINIYLNGA